MIRSVLRPKIIPIGTAEGEAHLDIQTVDDYKSDMDRSRVTPFIAVVIPAPADMASRILHVQQALKDVDPRHVYHVPSYFHLTVKLVGWLDDRLKENLPVVLDIVERELRLFKAPLVVFHGVSYFPGVVYLKVHDPKGTIRSMNEVLVEKLAPLIRNFSFEGNSFMPHVTITTLRTKDVDRLLGKVGSMANTGLGGTVLSEVRIVEFRAHLAYGNAEEQAESLRPIRVIRLSEEEDEDA